jgi:hypothetical protein
VFNQRKVTKQNTAKLPSEIPQSYQNIWWFRKIAPDDWNNPNFKGRPLLETPSNSRGITLPDCHPTDAGAGGKLRKESIEIENNTFQWNTHLSQMFLDHSKKQ